MSNIKKIREESKKSQVEVATYLGMSQSQYSRYENDPQTLSLRDAKRLSEFIGCRVEDLFSDADNVPPTIINVETPYKDLQKKIELLESLINKIPSLKKENKFEINLEKDIQGIIKVFREKPNVVFVGEFDSGKSRIINSIIGQEVVPCGYTPLTRVTTILRHVEDKPQWMTENVWVLNSKFDLNNWRDRNQYEGILGESRIIAKGGQELINCYSSHRVKIDTEEPACVLVFVDAPILYAATLFDVPGFQKDERDSQIAQEALKHAAIAVYLSPAIGFLKAADITRIGILIRALPYNEIQGMQPLENLIVVASHAHSGIGERELEDIIHVGAQRTYDALKDTAIAERSRTIHQDIFLSDIQSRFCSFWHESPDRRSDFEKKLSKLLGVSYRFILTKAFESKLQQFKNSSLKSIQRMIEQYEELLLNKDQAEAKLSKLLSNEPKCKEFRENLKKEIIGQMDNATKSAKDEFRKQYERIMNYSYIEDIIRKKYNSKNDAKDYAPAYINEIIFDEIRKILKIHGDELAKKINSYLSSFNGIELCKSKLPVFHSEFAFDSKGAFISGLTGLTTVGILSAWFVSLGNLGGYIAVTKFASIISALGIPIGSAGTAGFVSFAALLGGPTMIAWLLGLLIALGTWLLAGASWQNRLAKGIIKVFKDKCALEKNIGNIDEAFSLAKKAFYKGAEEVEHQYAAYLENLMCIIKSTSPEDIRASIAELEKIKRFFKDIDIL